MALAIFALWLATGLTGALLLLPPRDVQPGFLRSTTLVILGLLVTASLAGWEAGSVWWRAGLIAGACLSLVSSTAWELDRATLGLATMLVLALLLISLVSMFATVAGPLAAIAGSALLGASTLAMLLGHYYLTAPWMSLAPLYRLLVGIFAACALQAGLAIAGWSAGGFPSIGGESALVEDYLFFGLRWGAGVVGAAVLTGLAWQTLRLRHTQAATGILYVVVIVTYMGESLAIAWR